MAGMKVEMVKRRFSGMLYSFCPNLYIYHEYKLEIFVKLLRN